MKMSQIMLAAFCLCASAAYGNQVSAKKDGTKVTAEPKKGAAVVKEIKKGEVLEAGDREGMFWKVKTSDGKDGFVSVMAVEREASKDSGIQSELHNAALKARTANESGETSRARSAVMGVRGLNENDELSEVGSLKPDLRSVYHMEDRSVSDKRVDKLEALVLKEVENAAAASGR
jgi:hypothetical protein